MKQKVIRRKGSFKEVFCSGPATREEEGFGITKQKERISKSFKILRKIEKMHFFFSWLYFIYVISTTKYLSELFSSDFFLTNTNHS